MHHQYDFQFDDDISKLARVLRNMGDLVLDIDLEQPKPYYAKWSHFENPWDVNEAFGDSMLEAITEVYDQLDYILWEECKLL